MHEALQEMTRRTRPRRAVSTPSASNRMHTVRCMRLTEPSKR